MEKLVLVIQISLSGQCFWFNRDLVSDPVFNSEQLMKLLNEVIFFDRISSYIVQIS